MTADTRVAKHSPADRELQDRAPAAAESHMSRGNGRGVVCLGGVLGEGDVSCVFVGCLLDCRVGIWLGIRTHISRINLATCASFHF